MHARPQPKIFQEQIFIKHYAPYIEAYYHSTCLLEVQKDLCHCLRTHLSMEVHGFAVSKLQVRGQLCYPGHVVSFYQVFTRLSIWSLAKKNLSRQHLCFVDWVTESQHCLYTDFFLLSFSGLAALSRSIKFPKHKRQITAGHTAICPSDGDS